MPVTLPAHAAAVLPLCRLRWLPPAALVVGASVPDLAYLFGLGSRSSHTPEGLLRFSLLPIATWLQHGSSVVGSLGVLGAMVRRYPHLPEAPGGRWRDFLPVLLPTVALGALVLGARMEHAPPSGPPDLRLRWLLWHVLDGALAGLALGCVLARLSARRRTGPG